MRHRDNISRSEFLRLLGVSGVALALGDTTASGVENAARSTSCSLTPNVLLVGRRNVFRAELSGVATARTRASCVGLDGTFAHTARGKTTFEFDGVVPPATAPVAGITSVAVEGPGVRGRAPVMLLRPEECLIYRTSVRGRKACRACRDHAANMVYVSEEAADVGRPHPRCDCPIVSEKVSWEHYARAFWPTGPGTGVSHDRRWDWPAAIPSGLTVSGPRG